MKVKFYSDDELPLNKTIEIPTIIIVAKLKYVLSIFKKVRENLLPSPFLVPRLSYFIFLK